MCLTNVRKINLLCDVLISILGAEHGMPWEIAYIALAAALNNNPSCVTV
jgi:hypothetical protein